MDSSFFIHWKNKSSFLQSPAGFNIRVCVNLNVMGGLPNVGLNASTELSSFAPSCL